MRFFCNRPPAAPYTHIPGISFEERTNKEKLPNPLNHRPRLLQRRNLYLLRPHRPHLRRVRVKTQTACVHGHLRGLRRCLSYSPGGRGSHHLRCGR